MGITLPIAAQQLITVGVNMLDTIMVGAVGEQSLSAVSLANQFITVFTMLCMGIGMGASVLVSRYYGMKEQESLKKTVVIMLRLVMAFALTFCIITLFVPDSIMRIYTTEEPLITRGIHYLRWSWFTYFISGLSITCAIVLRCVDQVRIPLYASISAFLLNLGANYIFIFGKFGAPRMEEAGAALGTLIARFVEMGIILGFMLLKDQNLHIRFRDFFVKTRDLWKEYVRISIPVLISDGIFAIGSNSVTMIIGRLGSKMVAANAITLVTQQLSSVMTSGMSQAGAIVTGVTLGNGSRDKAQEQGYAFLGLGLLFGTIAAAVILLISHPMIAAYNISEETADIAAQLMRAISIIVIFQSSNSIMTKGVLRGGGDTRMLMAADNIFQWVLALPLGMLAGFVLHLPAFWIYICLKSDQIAKAIWCVFRLKSGKWIKKIRTVKEVASCG